MLWERKWTKHKITDDVRLNGQLCLRQWERVSWERQSMKIKDWQHLTATTVIKDSDISDSYSRNERKRTIKEREIRWWKDECFCLYVYFYSCTCLFMCACKWVGLQERERVSHCEQVVTCVWECVFESDVKKDGAMTSGNRLKPKLKQETHFTIFCSSRLIDASHPILRKSFKGGDKSAALTQKCHSIFFVSIKCSGWKLETNLFRLCVTNVVINSYLHSLAHENKKWKFQSA